MRCLREDRTMVAGKQYVISSIGMQFLVFLSCAFLISLTGQQYVEGIPLDLEQLWNESDINTPMICLLSQGSDPSSAITELAKKQKIELRAVSMGQGQEVMARELMLNAIQNGGWVLLQNCHLALDVCDPLFQLH